jgi:hypothetical protein
MVLCMPSLTILLLFFTVARSPASIRRITLSLETVLHLPSGSVRNVTLTPLSSLDTLRRTLSASTMSRLHSTLSRNSTLPTRTASYFLRYFILLDASTASETDLMRAITAAAASGNLTSAIRESDPSLSGVYLSGSPSMTVTSYNSPPQSDKSPKISYVVWAVVGSILAVLLLCFACTPYCRRRSSSVTTLDSI